AGIQHRVPLFDLDLADWDRVIRTDLTSAFLVGRAAARGMAERGAGKIINICSVQTDLARPSIGAYTAAKGGLRNLTRAMTAEWAGSGLQINGIAPGYIHTEMTQNLVDDAEFNAWILGRTPARRWGTVDDVAGPVVWLASAASDFVNGQTIFVDGGMTVVV
ncbi:MAG: SDR family oxidoreductase, partial [Sinomonas sp.]|nr:SDR family oxidoreductase [Sinomonas sp.]